MAVTEQMGPGGYIGAVHQIIGDVQNSNRFIGSTVSNILDRRERKKQYEQEERAQQEQKREFDISAGIKNREQNMGGIGMLAEQRQGAEKNARTRAFRQLLANSYTGA